MPETPPRPREHAILDASPLGPLQRSSPLPPAAHLADLLEASGRRDADAFSELVTATKAWATAHAFAILRDPARAQDCVQQLFLEVWQTAHRYDRSRGGAKGWMLALVRHRAVDQVRRAEKERQRLERFELLRRPGSDGYDATSETASAHLDGYVVREALHVLSEAERAVVVLSYWDGLSHSQIAVRLGLPLGTVKDRIRRSLRKMRPQVHAAGEPRDRQTTQRGDGSARTSL